MNTEIKRFTKAQDVEQAYDEAAFEHNIHSEGCYALAVDAAHSLGGVEVQNSNDNNSPWSWSYAPTRTFEFDDSSSVYITYGGVYVID